VNTPEVGSFWLDNDPRTFADHGARYARIERVDGQSVFCTTWYDQADGTDKARRQVKMQMARFQRLTGGGWSRTGFRPAENEPVFGSPA
jgi:hypothetical protein